MKFTTENPIELGENTESFALNSYRKFIKFFSKYDLASKTQEQNEVHMYDVILYWEQATILFLEELYDDKSPQVHQFFAKLLRDGLNVCLTTTEKLVRRRFNEHFYTEDNLKKDPSRVILQKIRNDSFLFMSFCFAPSVCLRKALDHVRGNKSLFEAKHMAKVKVELQQFSILEDIYFKRAEKAFSLFTHPIEGFFYRLE